MNDLFVPQKKESAVDYVINSIKANILSRKLRPGDRLPPEMELANNMGVSRGSVREAMKILAAFGIVEIRQGDGTHIANSSSQAIFDPLLFSMVLSDPDANKVAELRELIEVQIVRLIIRNADTEDLNNLVIEYEKMEKLALEGIDDHKLLLQCDLEFHIAMGKATRNPLVEKIYGFVLDFFAPYIQKSAGTSGAPEKSLELHKAIIDALKEKDIAKATEAVENSITVWRNHF